MIQAMHCTYCCFAQAAGHSDRRRDSAPAPARPATERVVYEISRLRAFDDERLPVALIAAGAIALVAIVWYLYRRDAVELSRGPRFGVVLLRLPRAGRTDRVLPGHRAPHDARSRSQFASRRARRCQPKHGSRARRKLDRYRRARASKQSSARLTNSPLIADLRQSHDVNIARFDHDVEPVVSLPKSQGRCRWTPQRTRQVRPDPQPSTLNPRTRSTGPQISSRAARKRGSARHWPMNCGSIAMRRSPASSSFPTALKTPASNPPRRSKPPRQAKVPLYTIGVGSAAVQRNIAIRDLVVPTRAFPNDTLNVTGYLQANGYAGQSVDVELTAPPRAKTQPAAARRSTPSASHSAPMAKWFPCRSISNRASPARSSSSFASKRRPTTATRATTSAKPKSKSSTAKRACCCSPAGRCATTSSCATSCIATRR